MWKITNISNEKIKIAVAKNNTTTLGIILDQGQFCITDSRMTSSIDSQYRRNFISIEEEYDNSLNLDLCVPYDDIEEARKKALEYKG